MKLLALLQTTGLLFSLTVAGHADDKREGNTNKERIVGSWVVEKNDIPKGPSPGSVLEFTKEGKLKWSVMIEDKKFNLEGTWTVDSDKLRTTIKDPSGKEQPYTDTITRLTDKELVIKESRTGGLLTFKKTTQQLSDGTIVPKDYRKWTHLSSTVISPKSKVFETEGGIHHIYANEKAMEGLRSGVFPDGATLVYDLLEIKETAGVTVERARRRIDLMVKDRESGKETAGWVFKRVTGDNWRDDVLNRGEQTSCFKCHASKKDKDHVFSTFRK